MSYGGPVELYLLPASALHIWRNKGRGKYHPVCGIVHITDSLLLAVAHGVMTAPFWSH